jgi:hypothetical protein
VSAHAANLVLYVALAVLVVGMTGPPRWAVLALLAVLVGLDGAAWWRGRQRRREGS